MIGNDWDWWWCELMIGIHFLDNCVKGHVFLMRQRDFFRGIESPHHWFHWIGFQGKSSPETVLVSPIKYRGFHDVSCNLSLRTITWLVVWNIFYFSIYCIGNNHPNWLSCFFMFFRRVGQPPTSNPVSWQANCILLSLFQGWSTLKSPAISHGETEIHDAGDSR